MSRGKIGPAPSFLTGVRPFLYIDPCCGDFGVSFRRSSRSLISARGDCSLGNPLLRLRLPRRNDSLWTRVPAALAKKRLGFALNGPSDRTAAWEDGAMCLVGLSASYRAPRPSSPRPSTSTRARARWRRSPCSVDPALQQGSAPPDEPPHPFDACRLAAGSGACPGPGPSNGARRSGSATPPPPSLSDACCRLW